MLKIRPYLKREEKISAPAKQLMDGLLGLLHFDPAAFAAFELFDRETQGLIKDCKAVAIQGTTLFVRVPSAVHRHELMYSKKRILDRIQQSLGSKAITDIQFELEDKHKGSSL